MEEEEVAREDEEDAEAEVMAVVAAEVCGGWGGGSFYKKSGRERGPFRRRDRRRRARGSGGRRTKRRMTGVASERRRGGWRRTDGGRGRTTSAMIRQKIRCTAIGCSQFELLASPVAVRQSLPDLLDTRSLSPFLSFASLLLRTVRPRLLCLRRRHRCRLLRRASLAAAAAAADATAPRLGGMGAGEKGRKNLEKKIQFRCHGDRRALTLIKIPRTSHLRRRHRPLVLFHRLVLRPLRSPLLPSPRSPRHPGTTPSLSQFLRLCRRAPRAYLFVLRISLHVHRACSPVLA